MGNVVSPSDCRPQNILKNNKNWLSYFPGSSRKRTSQKMQKCKRNYTELYCYMYMCHENEYRSKFLGNRGSQMICSSTDNLIIVKGANQFLITVLPS